MAHLAVEAANEKQAKDIVLLDVRGVASFVDYFVICSGESNRQIEAIRDEVGQKLKKEGIAPYHHEGTADSGWLLLDFGDVIVNIFAPFEREYYQLESLWDKARPVLRIQ